MKKTIFSKIFGGYIAVILLFAVFILIFSFQIIKKHYIDTLSGNLSHLGYALKDRISPLLYNNQGEELDKLVKELGREIDARITVVDPSGRVLADSIESPADMENHKNRPEIADALQGRTGSALRYSTTVKQESLYVALPVVVDGRAIGALRTSLFLSKINALMGSLLARISQILIIITAVSLLFAFLFSRSITAPIKKLVKATDKIASGDFDAEISIRNRDEIGELADGFERMCSQVKDLFASLSAQKEELAGIIGSIQEGLLVLDKEDRIILSNDGFNKIAGGAAAGNPYFTEVLREPQFSNMVKKARAEKTAFSEEIELRDRSFLCSVAFLKAKEEVAALLHDITEMKKLEKTKKDFVTNVSHELRTPLTAIKGFIETLEEGAKDKDKYYIEIIKRHTDRLINIVKDLLTLSEIEQVSGKTEIEKVDLKKTIEDTAGLFGGRLKEKGLKLNLELEKTPFIEADPFRLEQMIINLIDNAVKFTEKGHINVSLKNTGGFLQVEVEDTGIGIPSENLPRIFERFYTADRSYSRKTGGTGLGLSIVKHIILLHNGKIDAQSALGKGTRFTIILPLKHS